MKYCRFVNDGKAAYGLVEDVAGEERITRVLVGTPHESADALEELPTRRMNSAALNDAKLVAPVQPSKIICVGRNYREHAKELGNEVPTEPLLFLKPPSSLIGSGQPIQYPAISERLDYEGELGLVMGRACHKLAEGEDVRPYILGYTCLNDVTARDLQKKDSQWTRGKGFDSFCPVGPVVVSDGVDPWAGVKVETRLNEMLRQEGNTMDFIFSLDVIIRYISQVMTLQPGDVIATGTPPGVGPMQAGDEVKVSVENIGTLRNPVIAEQEPK
jgi:2-keto-4-pentenoate hydratase/2-oxohepta-3-ene-1,7-dioic acid hydratase in catechol pathway